ncbi:hypothetical protein VP01_1878g8 [Puccinia sorghi]|uniref:Uncharacterized protein n=1 Tax=Puccinia sorghi TaxID=27349 RepID=A0A0L6VDM8_9BASI|nr:hypothetical protein VP01_1878g8 [Puccinia sorghi]
MALVRTQIVHLIKTDIKNGSIHKELRTILQCKHDRGSIWEGAKYAPDVCMTRPRNGQDPTPVPYFPLAN